MEGSRYLFFTNECVGLGHLRRALALAGAATERDRSASALIVTGAPIELAHPLPPRVDIVKLPLLARDGDGTQRPGRLEIGLPEVRELRSELARAAARSFAPDVAVVDKAPLGLGDELVPALDCLHRAGTRLVLGLRDISDAPPRVRREWERPRVRMTLERLYEGVLVYGPPGGMRHALACIRWQPSLPVHEVGYVSAPASEAPTKPRARDPPRVRRWTPPRLRRARAAQTTPARARAPRAATAPATTPAEAEAAARATVDARALTHTSRVA